MFSFLLISTAKSGNNISTHANMHVIVAMSVSKNIFKELQLNLQNFLDTHQELMNFWNQSDFRCLS